MSLDQLQKTTEAVNKELTSGAADSEVLRKQLQDLRGLLTPENVRDEGTRNRLATLHAQVLNRSTYLSGLQQRTNVQDETLSALNQLSGSLTGHGIIERRFDNDMLHRMTSSNWLPYNWFRRAGLGETGAAIAGGATVLGALYVAKNMIFGAGRAVGRRVSGAFNRFTTFLLGMGAGAAAMFGMQRFAPNLLPNFMSTTPANPADQAQEKQIKETLEKLNKANAAVPFDSAQLNGINLMNLTVPLTLDGRQVRVTASGGFLSVVQLQVGPPATAARYNIDLAMSSLLNNARIVTDNNNNRHMLADVTGVGTILVPQAEISRIAALIAATPNAPAFANQQMNVLDVTTLPQQAGDVTVAGVRYRQRATAQRFSLTRAT